MTFEQVDTILRSLGGLAAYTTLGIVLFGVWRGTQRQGGRKTGRSSSWLRSPWFYLLTVILFLGLCYIGWVPLPWYIPTNIRVWMLALGSLFYFPGITLVMWGRLVLGKNYFVSSGFGAQLFAGHQLVTSGPFSLMRHPMYTGLFLGALGSILIYPTWTTLFFAIFTPFVWVRAWREETALAAEFGEQWREYCRRVPAIFPRLR
jgi:protein-S-isoprenylcysteine O-methyltransferase Ste14